MLDDQPVKTRSQLAVPAVAGCLFRSLMLTDPLRIGVLFSQTGFFGSTETEHLRGAILALAHINQAGGIHGQPIEPIICDPASNVQRLHDLAHELIVHEKVVSLFGCAASPMRKSLLPLV